MTNDDAIPQLARIHGVGETYLDFRGQPRRISRSTLTAILRAMGIDPAAAPSGGDVAGHLADRKGRQAGAILHCHEQAAVASGERLWGLAVQLYSLRSRENWGIGDFGDLARLARIAAGKGADFIGLNPLHAGFAADPASCSPYSPSSRHVLNVLYIAVDAVADLPDCPEAMKRIADKDFQDQLARLRAADLIDYVGVAALKFEILQMLFARFRREELAPQTPRGRAFEEFLAARGSVLRRHAVFEALDASMRQGHHARKGWTAWPEFYHDPESAAVQDFAAASVEQVGFHAWLQWIAESQLAAAQRIARGAGMQIGLYGDYAVGASPGGSETWSDQRGYCTGANIGAPPDRLALKGQDWGLPPPDPRAMFADDCRGFGLLMSENMRHFGALRIDHVMALYRLWWVPRGMQAGEGGYVHYPVHALFAAVARESRLASCMIIGENLGTVPEEVERDMADHKVYGYKVLYFERAPDKRFSQPGKWQREVLASVSTHDLPTLRAWWEGADLELRARLGMYPEGLDFGELTAERQQDRQLLIEAMAEAGVRPAWPVDRFEPAFAAAVHAFLSATASALVAVNAEDLLGMTHPVNVPGTDGEYPNWRRKLSADISEMLNGESARPVIETMQRLRPGRRGSPPA